LKFALEPSAVHKRCPQSGEGGGFSSLDILRTGGGLQMRTSVLFGAKHFRIFLHL